MREVGSRAGLLGGGVGGTGVLPDFWHPVGFIVYYLMDYTLVERLSAGGRKIFPLSILLKRRCLYLP